MGWEVSMPLCEGMAKTYEWIAGEVKKLAAAKAV
jgi:hypothetical protein